MNHFVADLQMVASKTGTGERYRIFQKLVKQVHSIWSSIVDLRYADSANSILIARYISSNGEEQTQSSDDATIGGSLFLQAVIFYARATETTSKARYQSGIHPRLDANERRLHHRIMGLRNDALAHFGLGELEWVRETVTLRISEAAPWCILTPYTRFNYRGDLAVDLQTLIKRALEIADEIWVQRQTALINECWTLADADDRFAEALVASEFDPDAFFRTHESATNGAANWHEVVANPEKSGRTSHLMNPTHKRK